MTLYLFRFDDLCPTMNWNLWEDIESILDRHSIKPIVAIVPANHDKGLIVGPSEDDQFWERACLWQSKNWIIGLHGLHHSLAEPKKGLFFENYSGEFGGFSYETQHRWIATGLEMMKKRGLHPLIWIAPQHVNDRNTLMAAKNLGFKVISDGFYYRPVKDEIGLCWIPQQFWRPRRIPFGTWTICIHPNSFSRADLVKFEEFVRINQDSCRYVFENLVSSAQNLVLLDRCFSFCFKWFLRCKLLLRGLSVFRTW